MRKKNYDCETRVQIQEPRDGKEKEGEAQYQAFDAVMNKATFVEDAITYIKSMQDMVQSLSQELHEMEATSEKIKQENFLECILLLGLAKQFVQKIDGNNLWVKMIIEKKWGRFKKLMEAMHTFGIELIDTNFTTIKGAHLVTTFMQVTLGKIIGIYHYKRRISMDGETLEDQQTRVVVRCNKYHIVILFKPGIETPHLSEQHSSNPYPRAPSGSTASSSP
ncbi:Transcription factor DYT1 [Glycine max]|nr:Transcription factor DYT1 [Glycine max]